MFRSALAIAAALCASSCASWKPVEHFEGWTLYGEKGREVAASEFAAAFSPAHAAVERTFGPFEGPVRVHVLQDDQDAGGGDLDAVHDVPGIGSARVRAYHARGDALFGSPAGIYSTVADAGTAVHEFAHARFAEVAPHLPLWFEEGLACFVGDGFLAGDRWVIDGLACWPLRELRDLTLDDAELARLLAMRPSEDEDVRENVLVHFVGWAIVFDLHRESGAFDWRAWAEHEAPTMSVAEARERITRTLSESTEMEWLERLSDDDPAVRIAAAKGMWKLRSRKVVETLLDALENEEDPETRVALAINVLAAAGEMRLSGRLSGRMWRACWPVVKNGELADPAENAALEELHRSFRWRGGVDSQRALDGLKRFWAE